MFHRKLDLLFQFILYIAALYCLLALDANLNLPTLSVQLLRQAGYEVAAIVQDSPGAKDSKVLISEA